jgi:hypothetical protein
MIFMIQLSVPIVRATLEVPIDNDGLPTNHTLVTDFISRRVGQRCPQPATRVLGTR